MPTNSQPVRYRQRPNEVDAIQWTGHNADALRAFAGIDFATIDPEDRVEDLDCDAQLLVEASHWVGIKPGDWVLKFEGYFIAKDDVPFRAVWEPAAPVPEVVGAEALARLLNGADVHIHDGHHPGWDSLAESGEEQYLGMARWLLKRLYVTERTAAAPAVPSAPADRAALERVRAVLESEAVVGRSALDYRGLITSALMADEAQQRASLAETIAAKRQEPAFVQLAEAWSTSGSLIDDGLPAPLRRAWDDCPGFPEQCPNLRPVDPDPPTHLGGIRCGCADKEATS